MRLALFLALIISALTVLGLSQRSFERRESRRLRAQVQSVQRFDDKADKTADPSENNPRWLVEGMGATTDEARQDALEKAQTKIIARLREQNPPLDCVPPLSFVHEHLVKNDTEEEPRQLDAPVGQVKVVRLEVVLTPHDCGLILEMDRHVHMERRMFLSAEVLGCLVALFAAVAGYVRLDEWSKGYYTTWLRLAAVGFVGGAVALLLLVR